MVFTKTETQTSKSETQAKGGPKGIRAAVMGASDGARNRQAILDYLIGHPGNSAPEIAAVVGFSVQTVRHHLNALSDRNLVVKDGPGWSRTGSGLVTPGRVDLDPLYAMLPSHPAYRATVRLMLSTIVARTHLSEVESGWLGGIVWGTRANGTGTGKTMLGRVIADLCGLSRAESIWLAGDRTAGDLIGRRAQRKGGGIGFDPSPMLARPFLCLDELDKADEAGKRAARRMLTGDSQIEIEGSVVDLRAAVLVTMNTRDRSPLAVLDEPYLRRCVQLFTDGITTPAEVRSAARKLSASGVVPVLDLASLMPTFDRLPDNLADLIDIEVPARFVAEPFANIYPAEGLGLCALGLTGLAGVDLETAVLTVIGDWLVCAYTWDGTTEALLDRFDHAYGGSDVPASALGPTGEVDADDDETIEARAIDDLDHAGNVGEARTVVREAIKRLGPASRDTLTSGRLRGQLSEADRQLAGSTPRTWRGIVRAIAPLLAEVDQLDRERAAVEVIAHPVTARTRKVIGPGKPDRLAMLRRIRAGSVKGEVCSVLAAQGLVVEDPPPIPDPRGRRRYRDLATRGAVVWSGDSLTDPMVLGIIDQAIAAEGAERSSALMSPVLRMLRPGEVA